MILTQEELRSLTGRRYAAWQARELQAMGVPYLRRGTRLVVRQADVDALFDRRQDDAPNLARVAAR